MASFHIVLSIDGLLSRMDWDDNDEFYRDRRDSLIYSDEESSYNEEEEDYHQCGDYQEDQQSQSEDIDVIIFL